MQRNLKAMWNFRVVDLGDQNRLFTMLGARSQGEEQWRKSKRELKTERGEKDRSRFVQEWSAYARQSETWGGGSEEEGS